ncbi:DUF883 family protein [Thiosocius teredinicola]|uniref:DUF883 family protein n=1 Tax=Thiosocius teredinicola TaxID=1973002 RepID=UPI000990A1DF
MNEPNEINDINDMKSKRNYSERATSAAHDAVDRVGAQASKAEEHLRATAEDVRRRSGEMRDHARFMGEDAKVATTDYVRDRPLASLAMAFGAGVLFSILTRRR